MIVFAAVKPYRAFCASGCGVAVCLPLRSVARRAGSAVQEVRFFKGGSHGRPTGFLAMIALLANCGKPVFLRHLVDVIYGDCPDGGPDNAMKSVYACVYRLRSMFHHLGFRLLGSQSGLSQGTFMVEAR